MPSKKENKTGKKRKKKVQEREDRPKDKELKKDRIDGKSQKFSDEFLKEVVGMVAGRPSEEIVDFLDTKKYVNEFLISKKLDITINQTRNILYKISDYGLVSNTRKKDKKKGWYTYFWKIEALKSFEFLRAHLLKRIYQTENQIKSRRENRFYICERCHIELKEENAMLYDFVCQECGSVLSLKDNAKLIRELEKKLNSYRRKLSLVEEEVGKEKEKVVKKREREIKKKKRASKLKRKRTLSKKRAKKQDKILSKFPGPKTKERKSNKGGRKPKKTLSRKKTKSKKKSKIRGSKLKYSRVGKTTKKGYGKGKNRKSQRQKKSSRKKTSSKKK